jgi:hypothetical protein
MAEPVATMYGISAGRGEGAEADPSAPLPQRMRLPAGVHGLSGAGPASPRLTHHSPFSAGRRPSQTLHSERGAPSTGFSTTSIDTLAAP